MKNVLRKMQVIVVLMLFLNIFGCNTECEQNAVTVSTTEELKNALSKAEAGDTIYLEHAIYKGNFALLPGVSLKALEGSKPVIEDESAGSSVLNVKLGDKVTSITGITIKNKFANGIYVSGKGEIIIKDTTVESSSYIGVYVNDITKLTINNLELTGNVTGDMQNLITVSPDRAKYAAGGLLVKKCESADINNVKATAFASFGASFSSTQVKWKTGEVYDVVGTGVFVEGDKKADFEDIDVHDIKNGATPFGYGIVGSNGITLNTKNVSLTKNALAGMLLDKSKGIHEDITVNSNINRGVWVQFCGEDSNEENEGAEENVEPIIKFIGNNPNFDNNSGVALGIFQSYNIELNNIQINNTQKIKMVTANTETSMTEIGDAVEIINSNKLILKNMIIDSNTRSGIFIEGNSAPVEGTENNISELNIQIEDVEISGEGDRGFVIQNATIGKKPTVIGDQLIQADLAGGVLDVAKEVAVDSIPTTSIIDTNTIIDSNTLSPAE